MRSQGEKGITERNDRKSERLSARARLLKPETYDQEGRRSLWTKGCVDMLDTFGVSPKITEILLYVQVSLRRYCSKFKEK